VVLVDGRVQVPLFEQEPDGVADSSGVEPRREPSDDVVDGSTLRATTERGDLSLGLPLHPREPVCSDGVGVTGGRGRSGSGSSSSGRSSSIGSIDLDSSSTTGRPLAQVRVLEQTLRQVPRHLVVVGHGPDVERNERPRAVERAEIAVDADVVARLPACAARGGAATLSASLLVVGVAPVLDRDDTRAVVDAEDGRGGVLGGVEDLADDGELSECWLRWRWWW